MVTALERLLRSYGNRLTKLERRSKNRPGGSSSPFPSRLNADGLQIINWNDATKQGFYYSSPGAANAPGATLSYGGIVYRAADNVLVQEVVAATPNADGDLVAKRRQQVSGVWSAWRDAVPGSAIPPAPSASTMFNVVDYGAKPISSFDNLPAFNAAFAACVAAGGGTIYIPAGSYRLSGEWNIYRANSPRIDITIRGESQYATKVFSNFYGADKSLIKSVDPAGNTRTSPTSIVDIQLGTVSRSGGVNPCLVDLFGLGESRLESVRFGTSNNTHLRVSSAQNVRMRDIVSFGASQHFNYRDTTGITFTSTAGGQKLTSSADIFTANDTGRLINVFGPTVRASYRISSYTGPREVSISGGTPTFAITNGSGYFEPARGSMTAGDNRLTANAQIFSPDDVGRTIYVQNAKDGAYGPALLRAKISNYVSPASVDLDRNASLTVLRAEFAVPAIDVWTPDVGGTAGAGSNDVKIDLLHVENYYGVGLVVQNSIFMHITDAKIHGEQTPTPTAGSTSHMWLDDFGGTIGIDLDGLSMGAERIYVCNSNDLLTFEYLATRNNFNDIVLAAGTFTDPGGQVQVRTFNSYTEAKSGDPYDLISDPNSNPKIIFTGLTSMIGDTLLDRIYMGRDFYVTMSGSLVLRTSDGSTRRIVVANDGTITTSLVSAAP